MKRYWLGAGTALCGLWAPAALAQASENISAQTIVVTAPGGAIDVDDAIRLSPRVESGSTNMERPARWRLGSRQHGRFTTG